MRSCTRADLHSHTRGSDGSGSPGQIAAAAVSARLHVLALTDHHTNCTEEVLRTADALLAVGVLPVLGCEYSTAQGHLLVYGTVVPSGRWGLYPQMQDVIDEVNAEGGVCIAPHPFKGYQRVLRESVMDIRGLAALEVNGQLEERYPATNDAAVSAASRMGCPVVASSDAHDPSDIGSVWTEFGPEVETVATLLAALKAGQFRAVRETARTKEWNTSRARTAEQRIAWSDYQREEAVSFFKHWAGSSDSTPGGRLGGR